MRNQPLLKQLSQLRKRRHSEFLGLPGGALEAINKTDWLTDFMRDDAAEIGKAFDLLKIKFEDCLQVSDLEKNSLAFVGRPEEVGYWDWWFTNGAVAYRRDVAAYKDYFGSD